MHTRNPHLRRWLAAALAAAAVAAPAAQASSPDDRAVYRGTSPALAPTSQTPDDRALYRGALEVSVASDDRPFARNVHEIDPGTPPVAIVTASHGFDWGDAVIGGTFGLAVALLALGAVLVAQRRRHTLTPA
jgi:hypothetical protein